MWGKQYYFKDRLDAGQQLVAALNPYARNDPILLALPRGGVPVAGEIAQAWNRPLSVLVARKIGAPHNPEFGIGAIAENEVTVIDDHAVSKLRLTPAVIEPIIAAEKDELDRRVYLYRGGKALVGISDETVILVDDGLATGVTAMAAIESVKKLEPKEVIMSSPVCAQDTARLLQNAVDDLVCVIAPERLGAIGSYYHHFTQTTDQEVLSILAGAKPIPAMSKII